MHANKKLANLTVFVKIFFEAGLPECISDSLAVQYNQIAVTHECFKDILQRRCHGPEIGTTKQLN